MMAALLERLLFCPWNKMCKPQLQWLHHTYPPTASSAMCSGLALAPKEAYSKTDNDFRWHEIRFSDLCMATEQNPKQPLVLQVDCPSQAIQEGFIQPDCSAVHE